MTNKCQGKICPAGKICNPKSGYCVNVNGAVGKKILKEQSTNLSNSNDKISGNKKKISNPILTNNLDIFLNQLNLIQ